MITAEKIKQIQKQIKSGKPQGEVKNDLIKEGFSQEDINEVFKPKHYDMRSWYLSFSILFSLWLFYLIISNAGVIAIFLMLLFSLGMCFAYFSEVKRLAKQNND